MVQDQLNTSAAEASDVWLVWKRHVVDEKYNVECAQQAQAKVPRVRTKGRSAGFVLPTSLNSATSNSSLISCVTLRVRKTLVTLFPSVPSQLEQIVSHGQRIACTAGGGILGGGSGGDCGGGSH